MGSTTQIALTSAVVVILAGLVLFALCAWCSARDLTLKSSSPRREMRIVRSLLGVYTRGV